PTSIHDHPLSLHDALPIFFTDIQPINAFPFMFIACLAVCVGVSLATKPDDMEVLKKFYLKVRPWGFWGPVLAELRKEYPELKAKDRKSTRLNSSHVKISYA